MMLDARMAAVGPEAAAAAAGDPAAGGAGGADGAPGLARETARAHRDGVGHRAPALGVVVGAYRAADFIAQCLESVAASTHPALRVVVVDNASPDDTVGAVRRWASGAAPFVPPPDWPLPPAPVVPKPIDFAEWGPQDVGAPVRAEVTLIRAGENGGFAGGVNLGLRALMASQDIELFWILNPDCVAEPDAALAFARRAASLGRFSLMGGRTLYFDTGRTVQADGGRMRWAMGCGLSVNMGRPADACEPPPAETLDYIPGASMVASRAFIMRAGLMDESWFLYQEEIDWALRRGDLPLALAPEARVRHRAGASIGSRSKTLMGSPFSIYFMYLNHMRMVLRWRPGFGLSAYAVALLNIMRHFVIRGAWPQVEAAFRGLHGLPPPAPVRDKLPESIWRDLGRRRWR